MNKGFSIAIDGPVASGKGTVASALAKTLNGFFINTGGMYRCVALLCIQKGLNMQNEDEVVSILPDVNVEFKDGKVFLNGEEVTDRLIKPDVAGGSSEVAVYERVRKDLVSKQQKMAQGLINNGQIVIAEGRDTGTKVLPNADIKIFLTASTEIRAKRSMRRDMQRGIVKDYDTVLNETKIRDQRDTGRTVDPLPSNPQSLGYWVLDNSHQTEEETIKTVLEELKKKGLIDD